MGRKSKPYDRMRKLMKSDLDHLIANLTLNNCGLKAIELNNREPRFKGRNRKGTTEIDSNEATKCLPPDQKNVDANAFQTMKLFKKQSVNVPEFTWRGEALLKEKLIIDIARMQGCLVEVVIFDNAAYSTLDILGNLCHQLDNLRICSVEVLIPPEAVRKQPEIIDGLKRLNVLTNKCVEHLPNLKQTGQATNRNIDMTAAGCFKVMKTNGKSCQQHLTLYVKKPSVLAKLAPFDNFSRLKYLTLEWKARKTSSSDIDALLEFCELETLPLTAVSSRDQLPEPYARKLTQLNVENKGNASFKSETLNENDESDCFEEDRRPYRGIKTLWCSPDNSKGMLTRRHEKLVHTEMKAPKKSLVCLKERGERIKVRRRLFCT